MGSFESLDRRIIECVKKEVNGFGAPLFFLRTLQVLGQRRIHSLVVACALLAPASTACATESSSPRWAVAVTPSGAEFALEIAADDEARARGYMFRDKIGAREGMLFIFDTIDRHSFWMKNCRVRLDILWLDEHKRIVDVALDAPPCPESGDCPSLLPMQPARFVLEFAGGTARALGLKRGDRLTILSEPPIH